MYPPFVDRAEELRVLEGFAVAGFYPVLYLYGPEGCGKTRLLRELYSRLAGRRDFLVVYVDASEAGSVEDAVFSTVPEALSEIIAGVAGVALGGSPGKVVAALLPRLLRRLRERLIRGKHVVVIVDDVARPLGVERVELLAKKMLDALDDLRAKGAESVFMVATTSEGLSRRHLARHNYVALAQIWNLGRDAHEQLLDALGAPRDARRDAWLATGGNPRFTLMLSSLGWSVERLESWVERSVRASLGDTLEAYREALAAIVEDVDALSEYPVLEEKLLEANLVTPVDRPCLGYTPDPDPELGVGERYAWQAPVYKRVLARLLSG